MPEQLQAKEQVTIAYRIIALKSIEDEDSGNATGGEGCTTYAACTGITYSCECANSTIVTNITRYCATQVNGNCNGGAPITDIMSGTGASVSVGGSGSGGGSSSGSSGNPAYTSLPGVECRPSCDCKKGRCCASGDGPGS